MGNNSSPPNRWPALLLLAVAIFGPPSAATLAFTRAVTQNPWFTALLIVIYELLVFFVAFLGRVWLQLEGPWAEKVAKRVSDWVEEWYTRPHRQYYQRLIYKHRNFENRGFITQSMFTPQLEHIFIDLQLEPTTALTASGNPVRSRTSLHLGNYPIWKYLAAPSLANQHFVILGPPGSGKTTLLKHITLTLIQRAKDHQIPEISSKVPVLLFLRDLVDALKEQPDLSLLGAIQRQMGSLDTFSDWIRRLLKNGRCLDLIRKP